MHFGRSYVDYLTSESYHIEVRALAHRILHYFRSETYIFERRLQVSRERCYMISRTRNIGGVYAIAYCGRR